MFSLIRLIFYLGASLQTVIATRATCINPNRTGEIITVPEDTALSYPVYQFSGMDVDDNESLIFFALGSIAPFGVNGSYLQLNASLDYETNQQYIIENVFVREISISPLFSDRCGPLTVNVLPVNEFPPIINPSLATVSLPWGLPQNTVVTTFKCTDEDKEPIGSPDGCSQTFIHSGDDVVPRFKIVNETIVTTKNVIDYDNGGVTYTLIIFGIDSSTRDARKTGSMTLIINIDPVNESMPPYQSFSSRITLPETTPVFKDIFRVNLTGNNQEDLTYRITGGNEADKFLICQTTGQMYLKRPLDFESDASTVYYVTVLATDGEVTSTTFVNVTITDVNDNVPICTPTNQVVTIDKKISIGKTVTKIKCSDQDAGSVLVYRILSGDCGRFQVSTSGDIIVTKELAQKNATTTYQMKVQISDGFFDTTVWVSVNAIKPICCETYKIPG